MNGQLSNFVQRVKYQYNRYEMLDIGKFARGLSRPNDLIILNRLKRLGISNYRGVREGLCRFKPKREFNNRVNFNNLQSLPQVITTIIRPRSTSIHVFKNADIKHSPP